MTTRTLAQAHDNIASRTASECNAASKSPVSCTRRRLFLLSSAVLHRPIDRVDVGKVDGYVGEARMVHRALGLRCRRLLLVCLLRLRRCGLVHAVLTEHTSILRGV